MSEKKIKSRIILKHGTESDWAKSNFIPKQGEIVIFDTDENSVCDYERIKIGDGVHNVNALKFVADAMPNSEIDRICGSTIEDIVGGTTVTHDGNGNVVIS